MTRSEQCLVCENSDLEKLLTGYSRFNPKLFHKVAICQNCGHIQLFPLFSEKEYEEINNRFFGAAYMVGKQQNEANNSRKLETLNTRLSLYLQDNLNVLDIGAGEAWAMKYFKTKSFNYFAIEAVERLAQSIQERGGKVIGKTIFADYAENKANFDVIIFRHILEHLLSPKEALLKLKNMLSPGGLIYIALPNASNPGIRKGFRTSYIRPVHISYFCEGNVLRLAHAIGLTPIHSEARSEIYCLLKHGQDKDYKQENYYSGQKEVFIKKSKEAFRMDAVKIIKSLPMGAIKKLINKA